jgi:hypothetical protein
VLEPSHRLLLVPASESKSFSASVAVAQYSISYHGRQYYMNLVTRLPFLPTELFTVCDLSATLIPKTLSRED